MATFNYEEAIYGALCYIAGNDDNKITAEEKSGLKPRFLQYHYLSNEVMESISKRWSLDINSFFYDVVESLNEYSYSEKLEAYCTICKVLNDWTKRSDRWDPANEILEGMNLTIEEYNSFINN